SGFADCFFYAFSFLADSNIKKQSIYRPIITFETHIIETKKRKNNLKIHTNIPSIHESEQISKPIFKKIRTKIQ
ncbi:MAG TPA: hypothetical protein PKW49_14205, partial [Paludibacteraceae bacterium]|nr:hypothetical protein [Paludibacteraceae bacterium]